MGVTPGEATVPSGHGSQAGYTLLAGEPVLVEDLASDDRFEVPSLYVEHGIVSGMSVVIGGESRPYGVLEVHTRERRGFTAEQSHFLQSAANVLGAAYTNIQTRLRSERDAAARERRIQYHAALAKCAQSLLASGGEDRLDRAVDALLAASRASCVFVERNLADGAAGMGSRRVAESVVPGTPGYGETDTRRDVMSWDRMPTTRTALEAGDCISSVAPGLEDSERDVWAERSAGIASEIKSPIFVDGEWAGLIGLTERETAREWTDEDRSLLAAAATMIGAYWERDGARDALVEMVRSKNLFLASVSHELRAPITTVVGTSEILRDESLDLSAEERAELLDMVVSEGTDLVNIVSDLLAAAKADSGTLTVSRVSVSLRAQVAQVLEGIHQDSGARIEISGESVQGIGDPGRVRQIVRNLVANAQRYGGETIRVELAQGTEPRSCVCATTDPACRRTNENGSSNRTQVHMAFTLTPGRLVLGSPFRANSLASWAVTSPTAIKTTKVSSSSRCRFPPEALSRPVRTLAEDDPSVSSHLNAVGRSDPDLERCRVEPLCELITIRLCQIHRWSVRNRRARSLPQVPAGRHLILRSVARWYFSTCRSWSECGVFTTSGSKSRSGTGRRRTSVRSCGPELHFHP